LISQRLISQQGNETSRQAPSTRTRQPLHGASRNQRAAIHHPNQRHSRVRRVFMSRDGVLTFQERIGTTLSPPVASFNDDGTGTVFDGLGISFEADAVINRAVVARVKRHVKHRHLTQGLLPSILFRQRASLTACCMTRQKSKTPRCTC
jgi:hypothetical protein